MKPLHTLLIAGTVLAVAGCTWAISAANPHSFLGINGQGVTSVIRTRGNGYGHVVLRGGGGRPNYDTVSVSLAEKALAKAKLPANIMVDCFIKSGNPPIPADLSQLKYGCSVTDASGGYDTTAEMLRSASAVLREVLPKRSRAA